jgi:iron complex outermembrane receptor protein
MMLHKQYMRLIGGTALALVLVQPAFAQDVAAEPEIKAPPAAGGLPSADPQVEVDPTRQVEGGEDASDIVVTGTSIRGISAVGSSTVSVSRDQLETSGRSSPVDILREIPQVQGLGFDDSPRVGQNGNGNLQRGSTVNLRGLGSNATLLLIDGKRVAPTGNVFSFTEANQLPVSAIERIEVIADGASAIYGSDAVAGVVNYITRKRFDGVEVSARGTATEGYSQWGASIVAGKSWDTGSIVVAYDHDQRGEMLFGDSPFLRQDLRRFGGPDNRIRTNTATTGTPGNIVVPRATNNPLLPTAGRFDYYGVRPGSSSVGLTPADLLLNQPNLADTADYTSYLPKTKRHQVSLTAEQELAEGVTLSVLAFYNRRNSTLHSFAQSGVRTLPATSPYYITGIPGVAPGTPLTVAFSFLKDIGAGETKIFDEQYQGAATLRADLWGGWRGEAGVNLSRNRNCANCIDPLNNNVDPITLQAALNNGSYNPFSSTPASEAVLLQILPGAFDRNRSGLDEYTLRFDGPLFELPGGEVKAAVGASYLKLTQWRSAIGVRATSDVPLASADRNIKAAYAELFVPVVGGDFTLPLVQRLMLDLAIRTEKYSDVGSTTNPKIGATWDVVDGLSIRGAWGTSFRAPNLIENNPAFFSRVGVNTISNLSGDPTIGLTNAATNQTNVLNVTGSNPDLVPETATNYSFGVDVEPRFLPGFKASVTYYNVNYKDQITGLQTFGATYLASAGNRALYAPYIVPAIQPAGCVNGTRATYNPLYLDALGRPTVSVIDESNICSARAITYTQNTNAASVVQDGIDVIANYMFEAGENKVNVSGSFTKVLNNKVQIVEGGPTIDGRDIINYPISARGRGSITWKRGPLSVIPAVNYTGSYTNNLPIAFGGVTLPVTKIDAWVTYDLTLAFNFAEATSADWASGMNVSLNLRNLTNEAPPVVLSANGNGFDPQGANPFGTIGTLQLTKRF